VVGIGDLQQPQLQELLDEHHPCEGAGIVPRTEGLDALPALLAHLGGVGAFQHVHQHAHAQLLTAARHRAQRLPGQHGAVEVARRVLAYIAVAARFRTLLAEVVEQDGAAAHLRFGVFLHPLQLRDHHFLVARVRDLLGEVHVRLHVGVAVKEDGFRRPAIAPCTTDLLVVALHRAGQVVVDHEAHIALVDAHAEGDGGADHMELALDEVVLHAAALLRLQPRVVISRLHPDALQLLRQLLRTRPAVAIDDAALPRMAANDALDGLPPVLPGQHGQRQVGPVEAADEHPVIAQAQAPCDVLAHGAVRRGGERDHGHAREALLQHPQVLVLRAEGMAPGADAVRLVNREERDAQRGELVQEPELEQPLRRDVQQLDAAFAQSLMHQALLLVRKGAVQEGRGDAVALEGLHLVLHQGDERGDHHREPIKRERGDLVAQALATTGRHQHQGITAGDHMIDDGLLLRAEGPVTEVAFEQLQRLLTDEFHGDRRVAMYPVTRLNPAFS